MKFAQFLGLRLREFSPKKIAINPLIHWTSERLQAFMAGIEMEKPMTLQKIQPNDDYRLHPNLLTAKERQKEVGELINIALNRLNNNDKQGADNDR